MHGVRQGRARGLFCGKAAFNACVALLSVASVLLSTGTGGIEVSPPGPNLYNDIYIYLLFSYLFFSKENNRVSHMH